MRIIKVFLIAILSLIALTSCQKAFDVNSVHFSNDGGTKTITSSSYTLSIHDRNANYGTGSEDFENGIIHVEKDWLTAELDMKAGVITLTADKNDIGIKRTLYISGMYGDIQSSIPVVQEK